jgi:hypothetical protein
MTTEIFASLLIVHLIGDFILQDKRWAENKWNNDKELLRHVGMYILCWIVYFTFGNRLLVTGNPYILVGVIKFLSVTFISHFMIDFITSKITHYQAINKNWGSSIPNLGFFTTIGIDQTLHYLQLLYSYDIFLT